MPIRRRKKVKMHDDNYREEQKQEMVKLLCLLTVAFLAALLVCGLIYWLTGYNIANITLERI